MGYRPPGALARLPGWLWEVFSHPEITRFCGQLYWYWERELWIKNMSPTQIHMLKPYGLDEVMRVGSCMMGFHACMHTY